MSDLDALLAGIVSDPHNTLRWLIVADWLDDHGQYDRADLHRLHRELIRTCCEPDRHPERAEWQARIVELLDAGVSPCLPRHTLMLPGGVPLIGNFIPPGSFRAGLPQPFYAGAVDPPRLLALDAGFYAGVTPVTQRQWQAVMGSDPYRFQGDDTPSLFESRLRYGGLVPPGPFRGDDWPVVCVNWNEAMAFCAEATAAVGRLVRLPTVDEWVYAGRAGTTTPYHFGESLSPERANFDNGRRGTTVVASFPPNPWGLYDCHGNVGEWSRNPDPRREDWPSVCGGDWLVGDVFCSFPCVRPTTGCPRTDRVGFRVVFF